MKLSDRQRSELSIMDQLLSDDETLRAIADLFPRPPASSDRPAARRAPAVERRVTHRMSALARIGVALAAVGLILAVAAAPFNLPALAATGVALSVCGGALFVINARRGLGTGRAGGMWRDHRITAGIHVPEEAEHDAV